MFPKSTTNCLYKLYVHHTKLFGLLKNRNLFLQKSFITHLYAPKIDLGCAVIALLSLKGDPRWKQKKGLYFRHRMRIEKKIM